MWIWGEVEDGTNKSSLTILLADLEYEYILWLKKVLISVHLSLPPVIIILTVKRNIHGYAHCIIYIICTSMCFWEQTFNTVLSLLLFPGPTTWHKTYPEALGKRQSPIDIRSTKVLSDDGLVAKSLSWKYVAENTLVLVNPGYCWKVEVNGEGSGEFYNYGCICVFSIHWCQFSVRKPCHFP